MLATKPISSHHLSGAGRMATQASVMLKEELDHLNMLILHCDGKRRLAILRLNLSTFADKKSIFADKELNNLGVSFCHCEEKRRSSERVLQLDLSTLVKEKFGSKPVSTSHRPH